MTPSWWRRAPTAPSVFPRKPLVVLLDVGGVMHLPDPHVIREALAPIHRIDVERVDYAHYAAVSGFAEKPASNRPYLEAYARALGVVEPGLEAAVAALTRAFIDGHRLWTRVPSPARAGLRALSQSGVRLGVISNADGTVERRLRDQGLLQVGAGAGVAVEVVVDSTVVGVEKPDPRIFHHALTKLKVDARDCWYVGDVVGVDVVGAKGAGIMPILFDPYGLQAPAGVASVGSLVELASLVRIVSARASANVIR